MRVYRAVGIALVIQAGFVLTACTPEAITAFTSVATVIVQPDTLVIEVDAHAPLSAAGYNAYGFPMLGLPPSWSSADPAIAQVTQSGDVAGIDTGVTTITATLSGKAGTSTVRVRRSVATVIVAPASAALTPGQSVQLTATLLSVSGQLITGRTVTWSSSSPAVATVSATGLVTAVTSGVAVVTASCEGKSGSATVSVNPIPVASVAVTPASAALFVGGTAQLTATAKDANGNVLSGRTPIWSTSNAAVASVTATGLVTAVAVGAATITAVVEGVSATSSITTSLAPVASVTVTPASYSLPVGQTGQLSATLKDASGNVLTNRAIAWSSSNAAAATVSATGLVTPVDVGSTTVTATSEGKTGTAAITVLPVGSNPNDPELPRVTLDTRYVVPTGQTIAVPAGGDLQAALNAAQPCDVITLAAGATYTGSFTLPNKPGACWITIRSSAPDASLPAEGARMTPSYTSVLPKLVSPNDGPALKTAPGAHHYRVMALEIMLASNVTFNYGIVLLGDGSSAQNTLSLVPTNLILDRVYIHGHPGVDVKRCVALNSSSTAVIDSYLSECHARGMDSQAIMGWNGPGPYKIANNYLEAAGENVMFGGADPSIANLTPSDIEVLHNHFSRPTSWKGVWTVKNLFELKHAQRVLIEGNVFENHWADAQDGFAIVLKSVNQTGTAPWSVTRDVTFRYNRLRNASGGVNLAARPESYEAVPASRIKIAHNIFESINVGVFSGHGRLYQLVGGPADVTIEHNTTFNSDESNTAVSFVVAPPQLANFVFRNNVTTRGQYGVFGSDYGEGKPALDYYAAPGYVFQRNVIVAGNAAIYPVGNFFPASIALVGFMNLAGSNYRLAGSSPYKLQATDGTDPGADIDAVEAKTQGVVVP